MTSKTISTYVAAGYTLAAGFDGLTITSTGGVGGRGVTLHANAYLDNYGKINATYFAGVTLLGSGLAYNSAGASITGGVGVEGDGAGAIVFNYGAIKSTGNRAIVLNKGGTILNGGPFTFGASISGSSYLYGAGSEVENYGTFRNGMISISGGGTIVNGAPTTPTALMDGGGVAVSGGLGTVDNYGQINGRERDGVTLAGGGFVINGASTDTTATILGDSGVEIVGVGTVSNFGTIRGLAADRFGFGVALGGGGGLTNGSALDETALIEGYNAVRIGAAAATVVNMGLMEGDGLTGYGLYSQAGGTVTNGGGDDHGALIEGGSGVIMDAAGTVKNFGTIRGATGYGVHMVAGGSLTNGSPTNGAALIEGYQGVAISGHGSVTNLGTILGPGDHGGAAVSLGAGISVVNGDANHRAALIEGYYGLFASGASDTVTNFGTIVGDAGTAVNLNGAGDTLVVEAHCAFIGQVAGGGGTLELAGGTGTLTGLTSGTVTVSGSMAPTVFEAFATMEIGAGANFICTGAVTMAAGQSLIAAGTLTLGAAKAVNGGVLETLDGTMTVKGPVSGVGHVVIDGGLADFASTFTQAVIFKAGLTGTLELAHGQAYTGTITGFTKTGKSFLDLDDIAFKGAGEATFSGTSTGGVLTVKDGTHTAEITLKGNYLSSTFVAASDGHGGTIIHDPSTPPVQPTAPLSPQAFVAAMAGLPGGALGQTGQPAHDWRTPPRSPLARPHANLA